ncbi:hypothetical protein ACHAXR_009067 [Thalassiosira sp. AJA248-18]
MMMWNRLSFFALLLNTAASAFVMPGGGGIIAPPNVLLTQHHHAISSSSISRPTTKLNLGGSAATAAGTASSVRNLAVAGRIPWKKLFVTKAQGKKIFSIIRAETHFMDLAIMFVFSIFSNQIGEFLYEKILYRFRDGVAYDDSITFQVTQTIEEASRIAAICYVIDTIEIAMEVTGFKGRKVDVSTMIAKVIYATWVCIKVRLYKRHFFEALVQRISPKKAKKGNEASVDIFNKITDFFLFAILALIWTDILNIKGNSLKSIFALGSAGTFVLTLAVQDMAKKALNGFSLSATDAFRVGDSIVLGDGTSGIVTGMGWLNTDIRGTDELITKIPNSQLYNVRLSNKSRIRYSQVKQDLRFKYRDLEKVPHLCDAIKEEIADSCPIVVTDGSRTFRVLVDCRLRTPPTGEKYYEARQGILEAIARAARKEKVDFALPLTITRTD